MTKKKIFSFLAVIVCLLCSMLFTGVFAVDFGFSETKSYSGNLISPPTVAVKIGSREDYEKLKNSADKADNAFYYIDGELNITDADGGVIEKFSAVQAEVAESVISNFIVNDESVLAPLVSYIKSNGYYDCSVVSKDPSIIRNAKNNVGEIRGILDLTDGVTDFKKTVEDANTAGAGIILLSLENSDKATVTAFQSLAKTVWMSAGEDDFEILKGLSTGAFGIVGKDGQKIREVMDGLEGENSLLLRSPLNVAHRGDSLIYNENSLEGCLNAYNNGATHVELDFRLTRDGEVIVMHDPTINRTTNGTGNVNALTSSQIANCSIIKNSLNVETGVLSKIPTIDDVFAFIKDKNLRLFFEIKSEEEGLVTRLKEKLTEYGVSDKVVVISFSKVQLARVRKQIPFIWALDLNPITPDNLSGNIKELCLNEVGYDSNKSAYTNDASKAMIDRGFMPIFWTYDYYNDFQSALWDGIYGITNNSPSDSGSIFTSVSPKKSKISKNSLAVGEEIYVRILSLDGSGADKKGEIIAFKDCGKYAEVVVRSDLGGMTDAIETFRLRYSGGCGEVTFTPMLAAILGLLFITKKKTDN